LFKSSDVEFNRLSTSAYAKLNLVDVLIYSEPSDPLPDFR